MGQRGPRPTPTEILRKRGSWRGKINESEPTAESGEPTYSELTPEEMQVWEQLCGNLKSLGVLAKTDGAVIERYCTIYIWWQRAKKFIADKGTTYYLLDDKGNIKCHMPFPQVSQARQYHDQLLKMEQEFGLTPSARSRIKVTDTKPKQADPSEKFFAN